MPDWSYRTVLKPTLFAMPKKWEQTLVLGVLARLGRWPLAYNLIDILGHMRPSKSLETSIDGIRFQSPVVIGPDIDVSGKALGAFERFGVGAIIVGPTASKVADWEATRLPDGLTATGNAGRATLVKNIQKWRQRCDVRIIYQLSEDDMEDLVSLGQQVKADVYVLPAQVSRTSPNSEQISGWKQQLANPVWLRVSCTDSCDAVRADGVLIVGAESSARTYRQSDQTNALKVAERWSPHVKACAVSTGIHDAGDACNLMDAGANLVCLNHGLIHGGPGLPKRINEAVDYKNHPQAYAAESTSTRERSAWFFALILGVAMFVGGALALWVGIESILLPYDTQSTGLTVEKIAAWNPRIVDFMSHDRTTLAGTMFSMGIIYILLAVYGIRRGLNWAHRATIYSIFVGFLSFFSFLGYGYLDLFHAFVAAIMFQLFIQVIVGQQSKLTSPPLPVLSDSREWRQFLWGQLIFIIQGTGLCLAGLTITTIGASLVFVPEDIEFIGMSAQTIAALDPHLVPLIAHDRATFGGMLLAAGTAILLTALWGFSPGRRWIWWMMLLAGTPPYLITIWIHLSIDYTDQFHLAPVYIGLGLLFCALILSKPCLFKRTQGKLGG